MIYFRLKITYDKASKIIFFNLILRTFLEGYIEFALTSLMNLSHVRLTLNFNHKANLGFIK
jgi:hypothetical protein